MWGRRRRSEEDFAEEIRASIALEADRLIAVGVPADAARAAAQRAFGNLTRTQERFYESRRTMWLDDLRHDVRYALRTLARNPGFSAIVALTLAVGIGAGTVVYSFARAVLLRPLPYERPEDLVRVFETNPLKGWTANIASPANYADWRARNTVFADAAAYWPTTSEWFLSGAGDTQPLKAIRVTGNLFRVLGTAPLYGRVFTDEETFEDHRVAILSYGTWQQIFAGDPGIVGRTVALSGREFTVVGVMPKAFFFPAREAQIWLTLGYAHDAFTTVRRAHSLGVVARRKPGVSLEQAQAEMTGIAQALEREYPDTNTKMGVLLESFHDSLADAPRPALLLLAVAVGVLFLIVCTNVANLQIGRAIARAHEMDTRRALGAGRGRLVRQLLTESVALSVAGGVLGIGMAALALPGLIRLASSAIPSFADVRLDRSVVLAGFLLSLAALAISGAAPAFASARPTHMNARGASASRRAGVLRNLLVAAETGLSIVLVVGSVLLVRSMVRLLDVNPGFNADHAVTFELAAPTSRYGTPPAQLATYRRVEDAIRAQPGVQAVGASSSIALRSYTWTGDATVEGRAPEDYERELRHASVTSDYFKAMQTPLIAGRPFDDRDASDRPPTTIVNEALVRMYLRGQNPLASRIRFGRPQDTGPWVQIVGVVADEKQDGLDQAARPMAYTSLAQQVQSPLTFVVRGPLEPDVLMDAIHRVVRSVDKGLAVTSATTLQDVVDRSMDGYRFRTMLLSAFAGIALLLAALGTYGVLAYVVSQRSRELGIRLALGAQRTSLFRLVVAQGMRPVLAGAALGLMGALALTGLMRSLLFGVDPLDVFTYGSAIVTLAAVGMAACAVPAWKAMRVDPAVALRCD